MNIDCRAEYLFEFKTYANDPQDLIKHETEMDYQRCLEVFLDCYLVPA